MADRPDDRPIDVPADGDEPLDPRERAMHGLLLTYHEIDVGRSCPPLSELWRHVDEDRPASRYEAHLQTCPRCQKHLQLLQRELRETPWQHHGRSIRSLIPFITGGLAIAACVAALLMFYAQRRPAQPDRFGTELAFVFDAVKHVEQSQLRGEEGETAVPFEGHPQWLQNLVTDREALEILSERGRYEFTLQPAYANGQLEFHDGRLRLAPEVDPISEAGQHLVHVLTQDNETCDQIVTVLLRHLPNASESNRAELRKALDRWRAENVFGK